MGAFQKLGHILSVDPEYLKRLDTDIAVRTGRSRVAELVASGLENRVAQTLALLQIAPGASAGEMRTALGRAVDESEKVVKAHVEGSPGATEFDRAAALAGRIEKTEPGLFLKKDRGAQILRARAPEHVLAYLKLSSVEELLAKHDVTEVFAALRFMETDEWMHETFAAAYNGFSRDDFETRSIEVRVMPPIWREVAERFVAHKHHNVSHLKEFGVIFINPIREEGAGKLLRDFALIFHYFREIEFYSKMFARYLNEPDFGAHFQSLLRGDVAEATRDTGHATWQIIQRYLWKENPADPRLLEARVNPESVHWFRGQRDVADWATDVGAPVLAAWRGLDWVGDFFPLMNSAGSPQTSSGQAGDFVSFDMEDDAMTAASASDGKNEILSYHQREALWTKLFMEYAGGEDAMEKLLIENFDRGVIQF